MRCLANYEGANKNLERARGKNKDVQVAEMAQTQACEKFEKTSEKAKVELVDFKKRRVVAFKKNLTELAELQVKHAKVVFIVTSLSRAINFPFVSFRLIYFLCETV